MVIFDCNGVLVDSETLATSVVSQEFIRAGFGLTPEVVARYFTGRRQTDMFAEVEIAAGRKLPANFQSIVSIATLRRLRAELRATPHMVYALNWLRGPKCVASSSTVERIRVSLEATDLLRFFEPHIFSAADVPNGKPAPDLFLHAAGKMRVHPSGCIVVEDSAAGVAAAVAAGMTAVGYFGGSHSGPHLGAQLLDAGARTVIGDMRALKSTIIELRGW